MPGQCRERGGQTRLTAGWKLDGKLQVQLCGHIPATNNALQLFVQSFVLVQFISYNLRVRAALPTF